MLLINSTYKIKNVGFNLTKAALKTSLKKHYSSAFTNVNPVKEVTGIEKYESKIQFNSVIENSKMKKGFKKNRASLLKAQKAQEDLRYKVQSVQPLPISLKYLTDEDDFSTSVKGGETLPKETSDNLEKLTHFPFESNTIISETTCSAVDETTFNNTEEDRASLIDREIRTRNASDMYNWMTGYDNYDDSLLDEPPENSWQINYGTPDPRSEISNVPCGGCGALLHCQDTSIPGYIPSEIYKNSRRRGGSTLSALTCQRCYFLKNYNVALQVRVSPEDYPKVLTTIQGQRALVVVMVDLLDFPCSIWPGIADILGTRTPIVVVGNKVDLIPKDDKRYLDRIRQTLLDYVKISGFATSNIKHVALISAKTGYGVEELITSLQTLWKFKGDVYLVGCTNVGKSSLFNALLQSDYCKVQSVDIIQRATTSQWPGTTLNLLKFPIQRPSGYRLFLRHERLQTTQKITSDETRLREQKLKKHNTPKYATLIGHIGQSYSAVKDQDSAANDSFSVHTNSNASGVVKMGIEEKDPKYALSRWCYDTPGVVQPDQIVHLLTTEELMLTLPKQLIRPETFCLKPGTSLFIAGLARLDYLEGPRSIRLTVFRSNELPVTICKLSKANEVYNEFLRTNLFRAPVNDSKRLEKWPGLELAKTFTLKGTDWITSSKDVVLSNSGWIAVNCGPDQNYNFQAWTPEKRGCHIRNCLLPNSVTLRGARVRASPAYRPNKFI